MAKSTKSKPRSKSASLKPYKDFPLTAHPTGRWCKRCKPPGSDRTKTFYFGDLKDWEAAKARFDREWPYIIKGLTPPDTREGEQQGCTLRALCNTFLKSKELKVDAGELTELSYRDYYRSCERLIDHFGRDRRADDLRPLDWEAYRAKLASKLATNTLLNEINRVRVLFKYAHDQELIPSPTKFGQSFDRPSVKKRRRAQNEAEAKQFTREELRSILDALDGKPVDIQGEEQPVQLKPDHQLKAMVLLGLNGGLGNTDVANLHESHIKGDWLDYPRVKTEVPRRIPLWPETVEALQAVLDSRKRPRDPADEGIVFLTRTRQRWIRTRKGEKPEDHLHLNALSQAFAKLLKTLHINGRKGLNFYTLRRQFEIVGGDSRDQVAVDFIMGHADESMAAIYRQNQISDQRLRDVVEHVRNWLFGKGGAE